MAYMCCHWKGYINRSKLLMTALIRKCEDAQNTMRHSPNNAASSDKMFCDQTRGSKG